jgi:hypothetical protein
MATYGCTDSTSSAYGAGAYDTCSGQAVGAPNTGVFSQLISDGSFSIIAPLIIAIVVVVIATFTIKLRKKKPTDASL